MRVCRWGKACNYVNQEYMGSGVGRVTRIAFGIGSQVYISNENDPSGGFGCVAGVENVGVGIREID